MDKKDMICTFDKEQYRAGEDVRIRVPGNTAEMELQPYRLAKAIPCPFRRSGDKLVLCGLSEGNYGVCVKTSAGSWEGAFDIVSDQRQITRYGFLPNVQNHAPCFSRHLF